MINITSNSIKNIWIIHLLPAFAAWILIFAPFMRFDLLHVDTAGYILGAKIVLHGGIPYVDFWENRPPLVYYLYALTLGLCGEDNYRAINVVTLCFCLMSTAALYFIARKITSRLTAAVLAFFYPLVSSLIMCRDAVNPNTEMYMEPFSLAAVLIGLSCLIRKKSAPLLLAGMAVAFSTGFKQPSGVILAVLIAGMFIKYGHEKDWKNAVVGSGYLIAGFAGVWLIIAGYFFIHRALWGLWFQGFEFNFFYSRFISKKEIFFTLLSIYSFLTCTYPALFIPYFFGFGWIIYSVSARSISWRDRFMYIFVLLWHAADTAGVSVGGLFFHHYFVQWIPSFLLIICIPLYDMFRLIRPARRWLLSGACFICGAAVLYQVCTSRNMTLAQNDWDYHSPFYYFSYVREWHRIFGDAFYRYPFHYRPQSFPAITELVKIIKDTVPADQPVFVWGYKPELYLLSRRTIAAGFFYPGFIAGTFHGDFFHAQGSPLRKHHAVIRKKLISDLDKTKPPLIVTVSEDVSPQTQFFRDYLNTYYTKQEYHDTTIGLYQRKK